ncbi:MAG: carboxymuconolactone decarboxylase family protein [Candidatus Thiodiazotropha sp. (ex Codakia rugifera)]|nr:carboxymuconolactone decarboxylase family protein [Candidatus Thiodiazotropha sp. (ex Codakia rugifera)]
MSIADLTDRQQALYEAFYASTHNNECLDRRTEILVGLSAALAMNCKPCTQYYLAQAGDAEIDEKSISEVLAKVMAVAAGQKRLQALEALNESDVNS